MPKFAAHETLTKEGQIYSVGKTIELTKEQADALGDKVGPVEEAEGFVEGAAYEEDIFRELTAAEQKKAVEFYGGDLKEVTNEDARWAFVNENQQ